MKRLLEEYTREEAKAIAADALVVLPVGATEQHGPHLPVGTDYFAVERIARAAAEIASADIPVIVTPTLPFGSSHHHLPFGGTLSLSTEVYYRVLVDLAESLVAGGFKRLFILNGHGGNSEVIQLAARDVALRQPINIAAAPYWTVAWEALLEEQANAHAGLPGHAGTFETSLVLALRPELIQEPRPHRDAPVDGDTRGYLPYRAEFHGAWQQIRGFTDSPDQATAEAGQRYLSAITKAVAKAFVDFHHAS